jgi:type IV pilus assembly protein PilM
MLFGSNKTIGLDIGTSSIKIAELDESKKGASLVSFGVIPTPPGSVSGGEFLDTGAISEAVADLLRQIRTKRKNVVTGIWGTAAVVKRIRIPRMDENVLADQVKWEAEQYIPFDVNEIEIEHVVLRGAQQSPDSMEVLLVAAQRDYIFKYAEVVETAGVQCSTLDVSGFALANCYQANYGSNPNDVVAILNIGAGVTNFVVLEHDEVSFARDIPVGGLNYTNDIHKQMGVDIEEAEALKISAGTGQPVPDEAQEIIRATNETMADEVHRSFDFYSATAGDSAINKVLLTGGCLGVPGLTEQIASVITIPAEIMNPFQRIGYNPKTFSSEYIVQISNFAPVALGLALRKVGDS